VRRDGRRPTIHEVARLAGVSIGTVSNVLNGTRAVRAATREAVERAVAELGYRPNVIARSLITRRSRQPSPPTASGPRLTTVGYLSVDYTARLAELPRRDGRVTASGIEKSLGGPAANVAVMAAGLGGRWAVRCELITALGSDADSEWALAELALRHVEVTGIRGGDRRLSRCIVLVEADGRRSIVNEPLVLEEANVVPYLGRPPEPGGRPHCVHFDGYQVASMAPSLRQIRELGFITSMHTTGLHRDWRTLDGFRRLRGDFDLVFLNRDVARDMLGFSGSDAELLGAVARLTAATVPGGTRGLVLLTLGPAGAALLRGDAAPLLQPAPTARTVDTTGAGDAFAGVFLATWLNRTPAAAALRLAVLAASHSITAEGALGLRIAAADLQRWSRAAPPAQKPRSGIPEARRSQLSAG
jgi:ribokinase